MYTIVRQIEDCRTEKVLKVQKYKYKELSDAIDKLNKLRIADRAMYRIAVSQRPQLFSDDWHNDVFYEFIISNIHVTAQLIGAEEEALKMYFLS